MHQHLQNLTMRFIRKQNVYQMKIKGQPPAIPLPPPENKVLYILGMMVAVSNPFFIRPYFWWGEWHWSGVYPWISRFPSARPLWVRISHHWQPLVLMSTFQQHLLASGFFASEKKVVLFGMQKWLMVQKSQTTGMYKTLKIIANKCK